MATSSDAVWSQEKEEELIILWESKPNLYDISKPEYRDRVQKEAAKQFIADALDTSVSDCVKRMKSLRTVLSKVMSKKPSGSAAKQLTTKEKWIKDHLQFLIPHMTTSKTASSTYEIPENEGQDLNNSMDESISEEYGDEDELSQPLTPTTTADNVTEINKAAKRQFPPNSNVPKSKCSKKKREETEMAVLDSLQKFINNDEEAVEEESEVDSFCKCLSKTLKKFDERTFVMLKYKINCITSEAEMERFAATPNPPPGPSTSGFNPVFNPQHTNYNPQHTNYNQQMSMSNSQPLNFNGSGRDRQPLFSVVAESMDLYNSQTH